MPSTSEVFVVTKAKPSWLTGKTCTTTKYVQLACERRRGFTMQQPSVLDEVPAKVSRPHSLRSLSTCVLAGDDSQNH